MVIKQNSHIQGETIKVRFAPSPTGHPHIGNIRIAEYNYLFAKKNKGKFYLRLEDTDRERSKEEYEDSIRQALNWLDIRYEKEVWRQSERIEFYEKYANKLIENKAVYFCNCLNIETNETDEEEEQNEEEEKKDKKQHKCDCLGKNLTSGALRFNIPKNKQIELTDMVLGKISINSDTLENFVIRRSDGNYTYNFTVVIDDMEREITHVIRGNDHVYNTFKQLLLYEALGARPPSFGHVALVGGANGKKLSKRLGTGNILTYKKMGIAADAMFNYLARLSGGYGDKEILSKEEAIEFFDITKISKSQATFDLDKLLHLSGHYIATNPKKYFAELSIFLSQLTDGTHSSIENFLRVNELIREFGKRSKTLKELAESLLFVYRDLTLSKENVEQLNSKLLQEIINTLEFIPDYDPEMNNEYFQISGDKWNEEHIHKVLKEKFTKDLGEVCKQIRISLLNTNASPSTFFILAYLGKRDTLKKLKLALSLLV